MPVEKNKMTKDGREVMQKFSNIVILCVGTNKLMGDSVGPIVGQKLTRLLNNKDNIKIYGSMKQTLNLKNAKQILEEINNQYTKPFIITIDAALGPKERIETIFISNGKIKIGGALGHEIEYFSHINIKAIVGEYQKNIQKNFDTLNGIQRKSVQQLSNQITYQVCQMVEKINCV